MDVLSYFDLTPQNGVSLYLRADIEREVVHFDYAVCNSYGCRYPFNEDEDPSVRMSAHPNIVRYIADNEPFCAYHCPFEP